MIRSDTLQRRKRYTDGKQATKNCSTSLETKEIKIKITKRYHYTCITVAKIKSQGENITCWQR